MFSLALSDFLAVTVCESKTHQITEKIQKELERLQQADAQNESLSCSMKFVQLTIKGCGSDYTPMKNYLQHMSWKTL